MFRKFYTFSIFSEHLFDRDIPFVTLVLIYKIKTRANRSKKKPRKNQLGVTNILTNSAPLSSRDVKLRYEECLQNWGNARSFDFDDGEVNLQYSHD